jgi:hypothetical protein
MVDVSDGGNGIERIASRAAELGDGLVIHRALPSRQRRMVGAWCFLDHVGPVTFAAGQELHVGAHPHTCLQTFTWMIEGELMHRDSLGSEQVIRPGQVNLMTAGRGIVHTEDSVQGQLRMHAAQLWIALPPDSADIAPAFENYPDLPTWSAAGAVFTLLAGDFMGTASPVRLYSPLVGMDVYSASSTRHELPLKPDFEYGILVLEGSVHIDGERFDTDEFADLGQARAGISLTMDPASRILLLGGQPFERPIDMWWNFVGHSQAYITRAQADWESGDPRFGPVKDDGGRRLTAPKLPWPQK